MSNKTISKIVANIALLKQANEVIKSQNDMKKAINDANEVLLAEIANSPNLSALVSDIEALKFSKTKATVQIPTSETELVCSKLEQNGFSSCVNKKPNLVNINKLNDEDLVKLGLSKKGITKMLTFKDNGIIIKVGIDS